MMKTAPVGRAIRRPIPGAYFPGEVARVPKKSWDPWLAEIDWNCPRQRWKLFDCPGSEAEHDRQRRRRQTTDNLRSVFGIAQGSSHRVADVLENRWALLAFDLILGAGDDLVNSNGD